MPYQQTTLADLQAQLAARYEAKPFWVADEATLAINEALSTWNLLTGRWRTRVVLPTTTSPEVALPATLTYRTRVAVGGRPLTPTSIFDLDHGRSQWRQETTATDGLPSRPLVWAPISLMLIALWPADASAPRSLSVDGVAQTPRLVNAGDFVDLGEDDFSVLLNFALHVLALKKGGPWFAKTQGYFRAFLEAAAAENDLITTSQTYRAVMGGGDRGSEPIRRPGASPTGQAIRRAAGEG